MRIAETDARPPIDRETLRVSFLDGLFAAKMIGFVQDYLTPFLLAIGGTAAQVGALSALPNFFASVVQLKTADFVDTLKSRKRIITLFVILQAFTLLPISLLALFHIKHPWIFILFVVLFTIMGAVATPAWASLMSDIVPVDKRGAYFGWRNRTLGFVTIGSSFAAGILLFFAKNVNIWAGFFAVFFIAFVCRIISWHFLSKMREPALSHGRENFFTLYEFLARIKESNFAKFTVFVSMMSFSVNLIAPFFTVLMIRDLHFNYLTYTIIMVAATFTVNIMIRRWGSHADKIGNLKVIKFVSPIIAILPLLWVINQHPVYLVVIQVLSGFAWSGFNLCTSNFIYDAVTPEKRTRCIAYFNLLNGVSLSAGALLGGFTLNILPEVNGSRIFTLCLISFALRMLISLAMPGRLKEVRTVEPVSNNDLFFSVIKIRPILGIERKTLRY